jgi:hypothetical protein
VSSVAASDNNYFVGVADNNLLPTSYTTWSGQSVDSSTVLIKFTYRADLDLDGLMTQEDASTFTSYYEEDAAAFWMIGDLDYDALFTPNDGSIFGVFYDDEAPQI